MSEILSKEEIIQLKRDNKDKLIKSKLDTLKYCDAIAYTIGKKSTNPLLDKVSSDKSDKDEISVKFVGNTAWVCDSQMDVLTEDAYDYSIKENNINIKHLKEHKVSFDNIVGKINNVYKEDVAFEKLTLPAIVFESKVSKKNDEKIFQYYKDNEITQHSIGLRYRDLRLAINSTDEEDKDELALWNEYFPKIKYNAEAAEKNGYFWVVKDVDIHEVSCVLFGANPLTPTLDVKQDLANNNKSNIFINKNEGTKTMSMTLEEALSENIKLTNEINQLKADLSVKTLKAKNEEQVRVLSLFEAAKTFNINNETVIKFAKSNVDIEMAITSFEAIKEAAQAGNHVDTSDAAHTEAVDKSKLGKDDKDKELSAKDYFLKMAKAGSEVGDSFGGLL